MRSPPGGIGAPPMYVFSYGGIAPCFLKKSASTFMSGQSSGLWRSLARSFHSSSVMCVLPVLGAEPPPSKSTPSDWNVASSTRPRAFALPSWLSLGASTLSFVSTQVRTSAPSILKSTSRPWLRLA